MAPRVAERRFEPTDLTDTKVRLCCPSNAANALPSAP